MRRTMGTVLVLVALLAMPHVVQAQDDFTSRTVVVPVREDAQIEIGEDRIYKRVGGRKMGMDVYLPGDREPEARLPAVLFVHGGPLPADLTVPAKDIGQFTSYGRLLASSGLAAVTFSHRFTGVDMLDEAADDVVDALGYVRQHAGELSVDPDRICIWAVSAGPMFVTPLLRERPDYLRCVVFYYGIVDPATLGELGMTGVPKRFVAEYDAVEAVRPPGDLPRLIVARAGKDLAPLNRRLDDFVAAALEANAPVDVMNHPRGEHAFDTANDDDRSREIVRRTLRIVRRALSVETPRP